MFVHVRPNSDKVLHPYLRPFEPRLGIGIEEDGRLILQRLTTVGTALEFISLFFKLRPGP